MNNILSNLEGLLNNLAMEFRFSGLFPALFFVMLNWIFILPHFTHANSFTDINQNGTWDEAFIIALLVMMLGYTLNALEVAIIKFYEGYPWWQSPLGKILTTLKRDRYNWLKNEIEYLKDEIRDSKYSENKKDNLRTQSQLYTNELKNHFPYRSSRILPTELGNVIAAFEAYPGQVYGMDGIVFWSRLVPILEKENYLPYVAQPRYTVDFLLNNSLLLWVFGIECVYLRLLFIDLSLLIPCVAFFSAYLFYKASIISAKSWGVTFQVSFDFYRYHLAKALGLRVQDSFSKEKEQWRGVARMWLLNDDFNGFKHNEADWPIILDENAQS